MEEEDLIVELKKLKSEVDDRKAATLTELPILSLEQRDGLKTTLSRHIAPLLKEAVKEGKDVLYLEWHIAQTLVPLVGVRRAMVAPFIPPPEEKDTSEWLFQVREWVKKKIASFQGAATDHERDAILDCAHRETKKYVGVIAGVWNEAYPGLKVEPTGNGTGFAFKNIGQALNSHVV